MTRASSPRSAPTASRCSRPASAPAATSTGTTPKPPPQGLYKQAPSPLGAALRYPVGDVTEGIARRRRAQPFEGAQRPLAEVAGDGGRLVEDVGVVDHRQRPLQVLGALAAAEVALHRVVLRVALDQQQRRQR